MDAYLYLRKKQKLIADMTVSCPDDLTGQDEILALLAPAFDPWDLPRPVVLGRHCRDLEQFGRVLFKKDDFIESIPYDILEIELAVRPEGIPEGYESYDDFDF